MLTDVDRRAVKTRVKVLYHDVSCTASDIWSRHLRRMSRGLARARNRHFLAFDILILPLVVWASFVMRLDQISFGAHQASAISFTLLILILFPLIAYRARVYARFWSYASIEDFFVLLGVVVAVSSLASVTLMVGDTFGMPGLAAVPRSIPMIFVLMATVATATPRVLAKLALPSVLTRPDQLRRRNTLVFGAGEAGVMTVRELRRNQQLGLHVVGFLDDDRQKQGLRIHGVAVLGARADLPEMVIKHQVQHVVIAMPTVSGKVIRELVGLCEQVGIKPQIVPGLYELIGGSVHISQIREVQIEDLLRREPIETDLGAVGELLRGRRVLITGAGGSIGSELSRQVLQFNPSELVLLGHGENSIFSIQNELERRRAQLGSAFGAGSLTIIRAVIADFRFRQRMLSVFNEYRPEIVFHAGAHKHVPLMELNPTEAVTNNVFGTQHVIEASRLAGVERFVLVSTDKAVNPSNVMGASKRAAEMLVHQAAHDSGQAYMVVRFGNVLGSRGSVVLTMREQIANGEPVTVTHPDMQRYFMTIPEAVQLVLQTAVMGTGGEVFLFDMGESVKIVDLAKDLIRLSGLELGEDAEIVFTGVRPGEKLYEELFLPDEQYVRTGHGKIFVAAKASAGKDVPREFTSAFRALVVAAETGEDGQLRYALQRLVPSYRPAPTYPAVQMNNQTTYSGRTAVDRGTPPSKWPFVERRGAAGSD